MLVSPPYHTRSARGHTNSAHGVFWKEGMDSIVKLMSSVTASGAHGRMFCSDLVFLHWNKIFRRQTEMVEDVKVSSENSKERLSHVLAIEDHALIYARSSAL